MKNIKRQAKSEDFKEGAIFYANFGELKLTKKYNDGIWEAKAPGGLKCIFENEARFYQVCVFC